MTEFNIKEELRRKAIHLLAIGFIFLFAIVSENFGKSLALLSLVLLLILFIEVDYVRVELGKKIPILHYFWREKEKNRHGGQVFFLIGSIIALAIFDYEIALAAILMTVFGDLTAAIIGKKFGKHKFKNGKSLEGTIAEFLVNIIIGAIVINNIWVILVMAFMATLVETITIHLDYNLIIPIFAGFNGQLMRYLLDLSEKLIRL